jgi:AraC-like DNA-binding protein
MLNGPYGLHWNQVELHKSSLAYIKHDCALDLTAQGPLSDHFRIFFHDNGSIEHAVNGRRAFSDRENVVAHVPGVDLKLDIRPFELLLVSLRGDFVRDALALRFGRLPDLDTWVGRPAEVIMRCDALESMARWFCQELERPGSPLAGAGKPRFHAERMLLATFVECLAQSIPQNSEVAPELGEYQVRRAEEWIAQHATDAIGVEEIANAVGVGVRSLQRTFQRVRGYSPLKAIQLHRLSRTHEALLQATPDIASVTSIASEFGFFELGRFAQQYRAHFGENPSETLSRRV